MQCKGRIHPTMTTSSGSGPTSSWRGTIIIEPRYTEDIAQAYRSTISRASESPLFFFLFSFFHGLRIVVNKLIKMSVSARKKVYLCLRLGWMPDADEIFQLIPVHFIERWASHLIVVIPGFLPEALEGHDLPLAVIRGLPHTAHVWRTGGGSIVRTSIAPDLATAKLVQSTGLTSLAPL